MALQIRRGTTAERLAITFLQGEIVFDTTLNQVFIGDGSTAGGVPVTSYTNENAVDAVGAALVAGVHQNISFTYGTTQDGANRIDATVTLDGGLIDVVDDTSPQLGGDLDLNTHMIAGVGEIDITGSITASGGFSGDLTGNVTGDVSGSAATVTESAQPNITSVGTLESLAVTGDVEAGGFVGNVTTESITTEGGATLNITPDTDVAGLLTANGGLSVDGDLIVIGAGTRSFTVGETETVLIRADGSPGTDITPIRPNALTLDTLVNDTRGTGFSGPSIEFSVTETDGTTETPRKLTKISAVDTGVEEGTSWKVELYDPNTNTLDGPLGGVKIEAVTGGVVLDGTVYVSNNGLFTHFGVPVPTITASSDLTLYPDGNVITYGNILPGLEGIDPGTELPEAIPSGTFDIGSPTQKYRNVYLNGGLVTTPPTNSFGKEGDVAGAVAFDSQYIYRCTAGYTDGLSQIWTRAPLTFTTW